MLKLKFHPVHVIITKFHLIPLIYVVCVTVNEEDQRWIAKSLDVYMYREEYGPWAMGLI